MLTIFQNTIFHKCFHIRRRSWRCSLQCDRHLGAGKYKLTEYKLTAIRPANSHRHILPVGLARCTFTDPRLFPPSIPSTSCVGSSWVCWYSVCPLRAVVAKTLRSQSIVLWPMWSRWWCRENETCVSAPLTWKYSAEHIWEESGNPLTDWYR